MQADPFNPLPLGLSLAGLGLPPKEGIELAKGLCRSVALDATAPGVRARELGRSARRDLAASLRRRELSLAGLDLWIPSRHFAEPGRRDRAIAAAVGAIELCRELADLAGGEPRVCLSLPAARADDQDELSEPRRAIAAAADLAAVTVCDSGAWREGQSMAASLDPAAVLMGGGDPAQAAAKLGDRLGCARLSDGADGGRTPLGEGELDLLEYRVALATANYAAPVVLDCRGLQHPIEAARAGVAAWDG